MYETFLHSTNKIIFSYSMWGNSTHQYFMVLEMENLDFQVENTQRSRRASLLKVIEFLGYLDMQDSSLVPLSSVSET